MEYGKRSGSSWVFCEGIVSTEKEGFITEGVDGGVGNQSCSKTCITLY